MTEDNKKNRFYSENNKEIVSVSRLKIKTTSIAEESDSSRSNSNMFKFGSFFKPAGSTMNKKKKRHEFSEERKDSSENFVDLPKFEYEETTQKLGPKNSFNLIKKKKVRRRKSVENSNLNELKKPSKKEKAVDLMLARDLKYILDFNNPPKPHKMIMKRKTRKSVWKLILISNNCLDDTQQAKLWLLASGAANLINMDYNRNYYYILRDHNMEYPNPCFNQIELDLRRTFPNDPPD
jgi:hypothetical protein